MELVDTADLESAALQRGGSSPSIRTKQEANMYTVKVYVNHGYYKYSVKEMGQAISHGEAIMSNQVYRRVNGAGEVEFHHVYKVKVCGEGLDTEYPDEFCRT